MSFEFLLFLFIGKKELIKVRYLVKSMGKNFIFVNINKVFVVKLFNVKFFYKLVFLILLFFFNLIIEKIFSLFFWIFLIVKLNCLFKLEFI